MQGETDVGVSIDFFFLKDYFFNGWFLRAWAVLGITEVLYHPVGINPLL